MRFRAIATDYDGTLAENGIVSPQTIAALERARAAGMNLLLVTGRELPELINLFPQVGLFDLVVAENGGLLYDPASQAEQALGPSAPEEFIARIGALGVRPVSVGRCIVATWEPHETAVLQAIKELGLELQVIFNKGAVMILPAGISKASGLAHALERLGLPQQSTIAIGDAENDYAFLDAAGVGVAVANALPSIKEIADIVTPAARGEGVAQLIYAVLEHGDNVIEAFSMPSMTPIAADV